METMTRHAQASSQAIDEKNAARADETIGGVPQKLETYRKLLAAARKLFAEQGYHQATTQEIARLAGVAHGTFYSHFKDKTDCFLAFVTDAEWESCTVIDWFSPEDQNPSKTIGSWVSSSFSYSTANPGVMKAIFSDIGVISKKYKRRRRLNPLGQKWIELAEGWKQAGQSAPDFDSLLFSYMVSAMIRTGDAIIARHPEHEKKVAQEVTKFIVRSIEGK